MTARRFGIRASGRYTAYEDARILVIDDLDYVATMLKRALIEAGYGETDSVTSGRDAMRFLNTTANQHPSREAEGVPPVDLVITDVTLALGDAYPDGCALGRDILQRWPAIRLLFVTGYATQDLMTECPPDLPLLLKPFHPQEFKARACGALQAEPYAWPVDA